MEALLQHRMQGLAGTMPFGPSVSVFLPFKPALTPKAELWSSIKMLVGQAEQQLLKHYPGQVVMLVMHKLDQLLRNINYSTSRKSIAIYVSPVFEKMLYPDFDVESTVIVGDSFQIRQILDHRKQQKSFLLLLLSGKQGRIYLGDEKTLSVIVSAPLKPVSAYINDAPEPVSNFSDTSGRSEAIMEKFLKHTDNGLGIIEDAYRLPVFVLGPEHLLGHFKKITRHNAAIIEYIAGNYHEASVPELKELIAPHIHNWDKVRQKTLLKKIEAAAGKNRLVFGLEQISKASANGLGKLLVIEKNYFSAMKNDEVFRKISNLQWHNQHSYIHDALDDIIEKIIQNGGDVQFVEDGILQEYDGIALVKYF